MTKAQKTIIEKLLSGHTIAPAGNSFRLRDLTGNPVLKVSRRQVDYLKRWDLVRRKKGLILIDKRKVRQLHGNSFTKRCYRGKNKAPADQNTPPETSSKPTDAAGTSIQFTLFKTSR